MKIYYLGPENTFSHSAAQKCSATIKPAPELLPRVPLEAVVTSLKQDTSAEALAIVAYYNYLEGLVQETLDIIYENRVYIVGSQRVAIQLCLGGYEQVRPQAVFSHPKALAQCSEFLQRHYRDVPLCTTASTTAAAARVAEEKTGVAVASKAALQACGVPVLAENIGNNKHGIPNFTDFFVLSANSRPLAPVESRLTMVAITPHIDRVGLLQDILLQIAYYDINLAKIHSRPAIDRVDNMTDEPQMFYLEMVCGQDQERFTHCVNALRYKFGLPDNPDTVRVLGSYPPLAAGK